MPKQKNSQSPATNYITGRVDHVNPSFAYIVPQDASHPDIWVHQDNLLGAIHQDIVKVRVYNKGRTGQKSGKVVAIVEKNKAPIVGLLIQKGKQYFVVPDGRRLHQDIRVGTKELKSAKVNDKVVVKLTKRESHEESLEGRIEQVLGQAGVHEVEMHAIMAEFELPVHFPQQITAAANAIPAAISAKELKRRRDLRAVTTFTIDPEDAKDFDDALSIQKLPNGHYEVGIHIADASHYVPAGSPLDQEAMERGTSVYLVDRTIPMLPERLSNELCSLRPLEDKLTFSAIFELSDDGKVHQEWIGETVIHSDKRFTYEEAQEIITRQQGHFVTEITQLNQLAKKLRAQRFERGAINFETTEVKFELSETGKPLKLVPKVRQDTHKLVEEFMLLANARVATRAAHMQSGKDLPTFVYRTHDHPDADRLNDFWMLAKQLGLKARTPMQPLPQALNATTAAVQGKAMENIVQSLAIRAMAKALYTTEAKGHFGLALAHYTHFTSPIRRYPDIIVHRLMKQYLLGNFKTDAEACQTICQHASERERVAASAERASIRYKQVEWMQALQGQVLDGVIGSVTSWGIYVELKDNHCEGMVRLADMKDDYYVLDEKNLRIVGKRSQKTYRLGGLVKVKVLSCDLTRRAVTLGLVH